MQRSKDDMVFTKNNTFVGDIGDYTYGCPTVLQWTDKDGELKIGRFCSISKNVTIMLGGEHSIYFPSSYPFSSFFDNCSHLKGQPFSKGDVTIGNDVWIGEGVLILSGVSIGDGAIIGARSVISKDIAPYSIVAGNPAKTIRPRFDQETIKKLLEIKWWNWPINTIEKFIPLLQSNEVSRFLEEAKKIIS